MSVQYSVEFNPVKFTKYKAGAPKHLLEKGGRWQESSPYGGWNNIDYVPDILTDNKSVYECAPEMLAMLEMLLSGDSISDTSIDNEVAELIKKAKGVVND